ncbi:hypothetical protein Back2_16470 [Nocardioides baekrokdamisoli]|uniref:Uncharacterized protein n=1 Tax=Nocardioides baekrokdamisoli TaxID=1804624 RepID=A0A3G9IEE9_9ACTN|nr:hypothetical protein [Nocardioides baekrokdamisoli]BBH17360.1 hypothetical protein Back2_16470 [Nocardioides baekrokdamisoli]
MKFVKLLLGSGLIAGIAYLLYQQWHDESAGAAEWISTGPAERTSSAVQSIPQTEDELAFSDAEEEGWPDVKDPFEGQDPLTAPLPEDI